MNVIARLSAQWMKTDTVPTTTLLWIPITNSNLSELASSSPSFVQACQAVAPHFYHMAKQFPDTVFVDVPVTERNAALHQGLGIATLPFAHIYHPTGLVEEQKLTRNHIAAFKVKLESYVTGSCPLPTDDDDAADV